MSGIEIAGLILGGLPVLIEAIRIYKQSLGRSKFLFNVGKERLVEKLALALKLQQRTVAETIRTVLVNSGCHNQYHLEETVKLAHVQDANSQVQVLQYLGQDNHDILVAVLVHTNEIMRRIASHITNRPGQQQDPTDNLWTLIRNPDAAQRFESKFLVRARLVFSISQLKEATKELDDVVASLTRFASMIFANRQPIEQSISNQTLKFAKFLRRIRHLAIDLHTAMLHAWQYDCCTCQTLGLSLEDRFDATSILSLSDGQSTTASSVFKLNMLAHAELQSAWCEMPCFVDRELIREDYRENIKENSKETVQKRGVTIVLPDVTLAKHTQKDPVLVDNMCKLLKLIEPGSGKLPVGLVLLKGPKMAHTASKHDFPLHQQANTISLQKLLETHPSTLKLRNRMMLGLKLASNFLQLVQTDWTNGTWSKTDICFLHTSGNNGPVLDTSQPFMRRKMRENGSKRDQSASSESHHQSLLLELGIILLELWHNKTLESHFNLPDQKQGYYERWTLALKWLDDADQPPELYDKAVSHCVRGMFGDESRFVGYTESRFWNAFCQSVIEPLYRNCKQWR